MHSVCRWRNPAWAKSRNCAAILPKRVEWSHQLAPDQASQYTIANILGGEDHWDPATAR